MITDGAQNGLVGGVRAGGAGELILELPGPFGGREGGRVAGVVLQGAEVVADDGQLVLVLRHRGVALDERFQSGPGLPVGLEGVGRPAGVLVQRAEVGAGEGQVAPVARQFRDGLDQLLAQAARRVVRLAGVVQPVGVGVQQAEVVVDPGQVVEVLGHQGVGLGERLLAPPRLLERLPGGVQLAGFQLDGTDVVVGGGQVNLIPRQDGVDRHELFPEPTHLVEGRQSGFRVVAVTRVQLAQTVPGARQVVLVQGRLWVVRDELLLQRPRLLVRLQGLGKLAGVLLDETEVTVDPGQLAPDRRGGRRRSGGGFQDHPGLGEGLEGPVQVVEGVSQEAEAVVGPGEVSLVRRLPGMGGGEPGVDGDRLVVVGQGLVRGAHLLGHVAQTGQGGGPLLYERLVVAAQLQEPLVEVGLRLLKGPLEPLQRPLLEVGVRLELHHGVHRPAGQAVAGLGAALLLLGVLRLGLGLLLGLPRRLGGFALAGVGREQVSVGPD